MPSVFLALHGNLQFLVKRSQSDPQQFCLLFNLKGLLHTVYLLSPCTQKKKTKKPKHHQQGKKLTSRHVENELTIKGCPHVADLNCTDLDLKQTVPLGLHLSSF